MLEEASRALVACGLSETEARTYLALANVPEASAPQLARMAKVPRNRIYDVLENLQAMDLVEVILASPNRRFRARPPDRFLARERSRLQQMVDQLGNVESLGSRLFAGGGPSSSGIGAMRLIQGRVAANHQAGALVEACAADGTPLLLAGTAHSVPRIQYLLRPYLARADPSRLEVYLPIQAKPALESAANPILAARVRWLDSPLATLVVIRGDSEALWVFPLPDSPDVFQGADLAIHAEDCGLAADHARLLRLASARP